MHADFLDPAGMLAVPRPDRVTVDQAEGLACVYCCGPATVDLGVRLSTGEGSLHRWHPWACQPCASKEAARVHGIHVETCARCAPMQHCPDGAALYRLARAGIAR